MSDADAEYLPPPVKVPANLPPAASGAASPGTGAALTPTARDRFTEKLTSSLRQHLTDPSLVSHAPVVAAEVERALAAATARAPKDYASKARSLLVNIGKNDELRKMVLKRTLTAAELVSSDPRDLAPEKLKIARRASKEAYYALRQVSDDTKIVGWDAGTSGKIEFSLKFAEQAGSRETHVDVAADSAAAAGDGSADPASGGIVVGGGGGEDAGDGGGGGGESGAARSSLPPKPSSFSPTVPSKSAPGAAEDDDDGGALFDALDGGGEASNGDGNESGTDVAMDEDGADLEDEDEEDAAFSAADGAFAVEGGRAFGGVLGAGGDGTGAGGDGSLGGGGAGEVESDSGAGIWSASEEEGDGQGGGGAVALQPAAKRARSSASSVSVGGGNSGGAPDGGLYGQTPVRRDSLRTAVRGAKPVKADDAWRVERAMHTVRGLAAAAREALS
jgi:hypothetical protein